MGRFIPENNIQYARSAVKIMQMGHLDTATTVLPNVFKAASSAVASAQPLDTLVDVRSTF